MKLTNLIQFLEEKGARPQKKWSQNFLIDGNIVRKIVSAASADSGDLVIEIGPGPGGVKGALTDTLVSAGATVLAIERDPLFAAALKEREDLTVFEEDILLFPLEKELTARLAPGKKAKVVSNLPYHITSPILKILLPLTPQLFSLTLMVQKEVALRISAKSGSQDYSHLSLFTHFFSTPSLLFSVSPSCFLPQPRVESAVVQLLLKTPPLPQEKWGAFFRLTRAAFQKRRKMLRVSLKEIFGSDLVLQSLEECDLPSSSRPEELSLEQFLLLFDRIDRKKPEKQSEDTRSENQKCSAGFHEDLDLI